MVKTDDMFCYNRAMNRRAFIKMSGILGIGLASTSIIPGTAEAVKFDRKRYKVSRTRLAMGTSVSMTLIHSSRDKAEEAIGLAFEEIDRLSGLMNRFDNRTAISQLNMEGLLKDIHPDIIEVVGNALEYYRITRGAFDISVKPLVDLFKEKFSWMNRQYPDRKRLKEALDLVGSDKIEIEGGIIRFKKPGMGITLDGIAKGYIVDKASKSLLSHDIENFLINAGGDMRAVGSRHDRKPWTIAIQDPRKREKHRNIIHVTDAAVATSGDYEVYFDREKMFHHIVNPETGLSPVLSTSVSVIAPTAMEADALSTSVFVMNPENGTRFIDSLPRCESLVISRGNRKKRSAGWKSTTI
ncbi:FAD:protein FMN transferase [Thermodesulfobacteriota bacterium]